MKRYIPLILALLLFGISVFAPSCANTTQAPTGGPKDSIPPYIVDIKPLPGAMNVPQKGFKVIFTFDEFVKIAKPMSIYLSPPPDKRPKASIKNKNLIVEFESELLPNTTYTLNLNDAIEDNNEGNKFPGFSYVFSTGANIDSLMVTGTVLDSKSLKPVKNATVMLYKDWSDSAVMLKKPYAAGMTDDWGFFYIPFIQDTVYRMYAVNDINSDSKCDPLTENVGFFEGDVHPVMHASDTVPELMKYDMKDTLACLSRRSEYTIYTFRQVPTRQLLKDYKRTSPKTAYISFYAPDVKIDSMVIEGYEASQIITKFDDNRDSLLIWVNDKYDVPDTLKLSLKYRKTGSDGKLEPSVENLKLVMDPEIAKKFVRKAHAKLTHADSISAYKLSVKPESVEEDGFTLTFEEPLIYEKFDSITFWSINPRQQKSYAGIDVVPDTSDILSYHLKPQISGYKQGYEYFMHVPDKAFRGMSGKYTDSIQVRVSLPSDEDLSILALDINDVDGRYMVDILKADYSTVRSFVVKKPQKLVIKYLKPDKYRIRISSDANGNGKIDEGSVIGRIPPEMSRYVKFEDKELIDLPKSSEIEQRVSLKEIFCKQ